MTSHYFGFGRGDDQCRITNQKDSKISNNTLASRRYWNSSTGRSLVAGAESIGRMTDMDLQGIRLQRHFHHTQGTEIEADVKEKVSPRPGL